MVHNKATANKKGNINESRLRWLNEEGGINGVRHDNK
jgi:hypothetical protein